MSCYEIEVGKEKKVVTFTEKTPPKLSEIVLVAKHELGEDFEHIELSFPTFGGFGGNYGEHLRLTRKSQ